MLNFQEIIKDSKNILVITSQPLDPDCISSGLITKKYLEFLGYNVTFRFPREINENEKTRNSYLPYFKEFVCGDSRDLLTSPEFDTIILLDGINLIQFFDHKNETLPVPVLDKTKKIIQIDHHAGTPEELANLQFKNSAASSTIEILLDGIIPHDFLNKDLATLAYIGLMGDTGNFKWNFNPKTLELAAMLLKKGVDPAEAIEKMFSSKSIEYIEMYKYALQNINLDQELKTIFFYLPLEKQKADQIDEVKYSLTKDAFVYEISKDIEGFERGIFVAESEEPNKIKVVARGKNFTNKVSLPELFKNLGGNGGGHFHAAGMSTEENFDVFVKKLKDELRTKI